MRRRAISVGSVVVALAALVVVLVNATLVDRRAPAVASVTLSAPVEGQANVALTLTAIDIQFSEPVRSGSVERRFRIDPRVEGTMTWDGSTATFTPSRKLPADTEFTVSIDPGFEDLAGNPSEAGNAFTFRTVGPPTVEAAEPAGGSEGVAVDASVTLTFDRLMDTSAVEQAIGIEPAATLSPSWSGRSLTLTFDRPLQFGTTYRLTVGTAAADTDGSRLRRPYTTEFTTVAAGLTIARTVPADGIAGVSVETPIAVVFDGPIDPDSIDGALSVTPPVGGNVRVAALPDDRAGASPDDGPGVVLLLEPSEPLAAHTTYTVSLGPVVRRAGAPDEVATGRTWRFTTGQPTPSAHNHIAYLSASGSVRDLWLMNPDGSAPRQVTSGLAPVSAFDVTLDGSRVAYASGGVVRMMAIDGSDESVLTEEGRFEYAPRFSPNGGSLLVARREADGADAGWWLVPLDAPGAEERQLLPSGAPPLGSVELEGDGIAPGDGFPAWASRAAWEPSGRWLLLTTGDGDVVLVDLEAEDPAEATTETGLTTDSAGAWSPSDRRFVLVGRGPGETTDGLYTIDTTGVARHRADADGSVAATASGRLVMLTREGSTTHVAIGDATGRHVVALTTDTALSDRWPAFSPDGETVLFGRVLADDETVSAGIWMIHAPGAAPVALSTNGAYPRWLP